MIKLENFYYRYSRNQELFRGLNLELLPGQIYGLLGKNGAGKSTLIKNIGGILFPTTGTCHVFGLEPKQRQVSFLKDIFFIPEECYLPNLTVKQFIRVYAPFYPNFDLNQYQSYLDAFGIEPSRKLLSLSFGQKKKTLIGFALATNTRVLILDEPTNGLDIPAKVVFRNMIKDAFKPDRLVIISSHQVRDLDELISALIILDKGEVLLHAAKDEILKRLYFGTSAIPLPNSAVLYQDKAPNGWPYIAENTTGKTSYLDMELLFNALLEHKVALQKVFSATQKQPEYEIN
ncbi:ABC transporter ATP-binding protein [Adhaeribacter aerolatus]|uniref:ABC transporter ATP-binding protein n=1 Tax=Adhaeribacter aerolatus TaxID=670289 RepID=A0A512B3K9_9BACT|nr:ABC transporter ATP-binding protein [Adhaeribacter aerolatus]GEO06377.1 ABC transporter ATP-binding protein [Adhaeribacter aerolatus]